MRPVLWPCRERMETWTRVVAAEMREVDSIQAIFSFSNVSLAGTCFHRSDEVQILNFSPQLLVQQHTHQP